MVSDQVIAHTATSVPGISLTRKRGQILIFRSTITALGDPCFIRFLMNMDKGYFALQRCEEKEIESFVVPDVGTLEGTFRIFSENICRIIWRRFGWDKNRTYRCFGTVYPEFHLVEFDLNQAEPISDRSADLEVPSGLNSTEGLTRTEGPTGAVEPDSSIG